MTERRMEAYYYSFDSTGSDPVDKILGAVACAGKSFHHTDDWYEHASPQDDHTGGTPIDWIQNAAIEAAAEIQSLRDQIYESIPMWQANELQREIERLRAERKELRDLLVGLGAGIPAAAILRAEDRHD